MFGRYLNQPKLILELFLINYINNRRISTTFIKHRIISYESQLKFSVDAKFLTIQNKRYTITRNSHSFLFSRQERNIIEAAAFGASQAIKLVANVAVNLVAFIALVEFLNQTLIWLGNRAGMEKPGDELTFQVKFCECGPYLSFGLIFIDQI